MLEMQRSGHSHSILFGFIFLNRDFLQTINHVLLDEMRYLIFDIMFDFAWRTASCLLMSFLSHLVKRNGSDIYRLFEPLLVLVFRFALTSTRLLVLAKC